MTDDGISPDYFRVMGVPLLRGRLFAEQDSAHSPRVAIINATMAKRFWKDANPIGRGFKFSFQKLTDPWITVVGVVIAAAGVQAGRLASRYAKRS